MNGQLIEFTLPNPGERLDRALAAALPHLSRAQCQKLIKDGLVTVDGRPARASYRLTGAEQVSVRLPPVVEVGLAAEAIPLDILYEDAHLLVVNKPAGMVVHPAAGHDTGTLVNAILAHCPDLPGIGGERRPGIVHRLDKDTSGLLLVAKDDATLRDLQSQFKQRTVAKVYLALVEGQIKPSAALIDAPIGRDPRQRQRMTVIAPGSALEARPAQTAYQVERAYDDFSLLRCQPHTGRTHQIRVHLAYIGYPIVGDRVYGRRRQRLPLKRHFLHAAGLTFQRPGDGQEMSLTAPLPAELQAVLDRLE